MSESVVAALYKFVTLKDFHEIREPLLDVCLAAEVRGTLLLAEEGINIKMISTSEIKVSVVIDDKYTELAVRALHKAFKLDQQK